MACRDAVLKSGNSGPSIENHELVGEGINALPYKLTKAQAQALHRILQDMKGFVPLDGLLQVDLTLKWHHKHFLAATKALRIV